MEVSNIVIVSIIIGLLMIVFYLYTEKEGYKSKLTNYNELATKLSTYDKLTSKIINKIDTETVNISEKIDILPPPKKVIKDIYHKFVE